MYKKVLTLKQEALQLKAENITLKNELENTRKILAQQMQNSSKMSIQTLSIVVPAGCQNSCEFCVSEMHRETDDYVNQIEKNIRFRDLYETDYINRMAFARDNGCNTMIFTGEGEPLNNKNFLEDVINWNDRTGQPFRWIEIQTSGINLLKDDEDTLLRYLRNKIRISTVSLSLSSIWDSQQNAEYNRTPKKLIVDVDKVCAEIKRYDFNLRLSLNMTDFYNERTPEEIFTRAQQLGADQITFRVLYESANYNTEKALRINNWIRAHRTVQETIERVKRYILDSGRPLEMLPFGAMRYSVGGISTVVDDDCMSTEVKPVMKYLILRPNAKLYTKWDDSGSLLF